MSTIECPPTNLLNRIPYQTFAFFKLATFVPAFVGLYAIYAYAESRWWMLGFVLTFLVHLSIIFRMKCTHCAYYRQPGKTLQCMWLWGVPKLFKENAEPESSFNKVYTPVGMATVALFPVYWLVNEWALLIIYFASMAVLVMSLFLFTCSRCTYFECGYNKVSPELRERYQKE